MTNEDPGDDQRQRQERFDEPPDDIVGRAPEVTHHESERGAQHRPDAASPAGR